VSGAGAGIAISGAATAIAAAAARKRMLEEEEKMTGYKADDLNGWEFKIIRANTRKFKNPLVLRQVCEEEARAGWEMVEKFDDYRVRFKRRTDKRANDQFLNIDPYRTQFGITEGSMAAIIIGAILVAVGIAVVVILMVRGH